MTVRPEHPLINHYRETLDDIATPFLDLAVLSAARQHSARRRVVRRVAGVFIFGALAAITTGLRWHEREPVHRLPKVTNYGWSEGSSREYLLTVEFGKYPLSQMNEGLK